MQGFLHAGGAASHCGLRQLEVVDNQLPHWGDRNRLDWSGRGLAATALQNMRQVLSWDVQQWQSPGVTVQLQRDGETLEVLPLWVAVHHDPDKKTAKLYESIMPLHSGIVDLLGEALAPMYEADDLTFTDCDQRHGHWFNYHIGVVGDVAPEEEDVLWPNQVIHRERTMYNVRNGRDLAKFLADPVKEDIASHLMNLRRLQEDRRYSPGWCLIMLQSRWGKTALEQHGITMHLPG
ncbi:hypothetical protein WJX72_004367 [[Myrmecia] bisecta]|uniref:Uncharacterized protein n=1 Tax=[Myrmecia] bisecta TaxID=41462 RepID=A0AAW1R615_9CHLO